MRVDPAVSHRKFDREKARLIQQASMLAARGVFLVRAEFPQLDLLYVPRSPLLIGLPAPLPDSPPLPVGHLPVLELPSLAARAFKARFDLTDYDLRAPSIEFLDPWTDQPLQYETMFRAIEFEKTRGAHLVLLGAHPTTHKPFLCLRGVREYHEHPQHSGDEWLLYRNDMSVFSAAMSLWRVGLDLIRPLLAVHPGGLQLQWIQQEKL